MKTITLEEGIKAIKTVRSQEFCLPDIIKVANATMTHSVEVLPDIISSLQLLVDDSITYPESSMIRSIGNDIARIIARADKVVIR